MQPKVFAIGDIHGCYRELNELLDQLPLDQNSTLIFLGDYVDRGPNSRAVIDTILDMQSKYKTITLMGNHEAMMLDFFTDPSSASAAFFIFNGGSSTLASYVMDDQEYHIPDSHMNFLRNLQLHYETDTHFFVHAGVPEIKLAKLQDSEHMQDYIWIRKKFLESNFAWEKIIVHGHSPVPQVEIKPNRICLDTGCVFNGYLTAMEMNSGAVYQVRAIEDIPRTYLIENPTRNRVAKRFMGSIPVFVESPKGPVEYQTLNYNEFGMLILEIDEPKGAFAIGQVIAGKIGLPNEKQLDFVGQVVRSQQKNHQTAFGIRMLELNKVHVL